MEFRDEGLIKDKPLGQSHIKAKKLVGGIIIELQKQGMKSRTVVSRETKGLGFHIPEQNHRQGGERRALYDWRERLIGLERASIPRLERSFEGRKRRSRASMENGENTVTIKWLRVFTSKNGFTRHRDVDSPGSHDSARSVGLFYYLSNNNSENIYGLYLFTYSNLTF